MRLLIDRRLIDCSQSSYHRIIESHLVIHLAHHGLEIGGGEEARAWLAVSRQFNRSFSRLIISFIAPSNPIPHHIRPYLKLGPTCPSGRLKRLFLACAKGNDGQRRSDPPRNLRPISLSLLLSSPPLHPSSPLSPNLIAVILLR